MGRNWNVVREGEGVFSASDNALGEQEQKGMEKLSIESYADPSQAN
jgi:hypothetical protein